MLFSSAEMPKTDSCEACGAEIIYKPMEVEHF